MKDFSHRSGWESRPNSSWIIPRRPARSTLRSSSLSHRSAWNNLELLKLCLRQGVRASSAMAFLNPLLARLIPGARSGRNAGVLNGEAAGNLGRGVPSGAEPKGLKPQRDAWGLVGRGLLAQGQKLAARARVGWGQAWIYGGPGRVSKGSLDRGSRLGWAAGLAPAAGDKVLPDSWSPTFDHAAPSGGFVTRPGLASVRRVLGAGPPGRIG